MEELILWSTWAVKLLVFKFVLDVIATIGNAWIRHSSTKGLTEMLAQKIKEAKVSK